MWALASDTLPLLQLSPCSTGKRAWYGGGRLSRWSSHTRTGHQVLCLFVFCYFDCFGAFFWKQSGSVFPVKVTAWCCWYKWYLPVSPLAFWGTGALHFLALHALIHVWRGISNKAFIVKHLQERVMKNSHMHCYCHLCLYSFIHCCPFIALYWYFVYCILLSLFQLYLYLSLILSCLCLAWLIFCRLPALALSYKALCKLWFLKVLYK